MPLLSFERRKKQKSLRDDVHLHEISDVCVMLLIDVESRMQNACDMHDDKHVFYHPFYGLGQIGHVWVINLRFYVSSGTNACLG